VLTVVGTGIRAGVQLTPEAREAIERADEVCFLVGEPVAAKAVLGLNPRARPLDRHYRAGVERRIAYEAMTEEILEPVRRGLEVCAAFYGHPGVFCTPAHESVRRARAEGFAARMLPGISAEACLFADLGLDPGASGCQSYEATAFLARRRRVDTSAVLVLWQVSVLGHSDYTPEPDAPALPALAERLLRLYPAGHEAILYEASPYPVGEAVARPVRLEELADAPLPRLATLVVPPVAPASSARTPAAATAFPFAS
jgi:precorrin-6B methylase 1